MCAYKISGKGVLAPYQKSITYFSDGFKIATNFKIECNVQSEG